jgi:hypothetical protein
VTVVGRTTLFTWGYYGWGNHTPQLVEAVDAVETSRGFEPPIFVDIRIRRTLDAERSTEGFAKKKEADARRREKAQVEYVEDFLGAVVTSHHPLTLGTGS